MKIPDKLIVKWGGPIVKFLILFALAWMCTMFVHVESHHMQFDRTQKALIEDHDLLVNLVSTNQKAIKAILENQMIFREFVRTNSLPK